MLPGFALPSAALPPLRVEGERSHRNGERLATKQREKHMTTPQELEARFWKALKSDMTMMLGLDGVEDGHARPMTAQTEGAR
jgi:hypothetical protein